MPRVVRSNEGFRTWHHVNGFTDILCWASPDDPFVVLRDNTSWGKYIGIRLI